MINAIKKITRVTRVSSPVAAAVYYHRVNLTQPVPLTFLPALVPEENIWEQAELFVTQTEHSTSLSEFLFKWPAFTELDQAGPSPR